MPLAAGTVKKVNDLKREYEKKNFKYDLVMLTRLDLAFMTNFDFKKINNNFYCSNHNDVPTPKNNYKQEIELNNKTNEKGISDFWFISSSYNIDKFASLYGVLKIILATTYLHYNTQST